MGDVVIASSRSRDEALPALRRAHRVGVIAIVGAVGLSLAQQPAPALTGKGLAVSISLAVLLACAVALARRAEAGAGVAALSALVAGSAALVWAQPRGTGVAGLFAAVAIAGIRLPDRRSLAVLVLALAAFILAALIARRSSGMIAGSVLGIAAFYMIARFARTAATAHQETRQLLAELQASRDAEAEAAMLRERGRLARDMHDVLAHSLSGLLLQLEGARMLAARPDTAGQLSPALERAHHLARAGLEEARRAIAALRDEDLPGADRLGQLTADFEQDAGIDTSLTIGGALRPLDSETSLTIYRVAQEALTNIRKHATPQRVELDLRYDPDGVRLSVRDCAQRPSAGEDPSRLGGGGYGLTGMRERAALLGGTLKAGQTDEGFRVDLWIPS